MNEFLSYDRLFYLALIIPSGILALWWIKRVIRRVEEQRVNRMESFQRFDAVKTDPPVANRVKKARKRALERIEARYTIIRRSLIFGFVLAWVIAIAFPFLSNIPANMVSLMAAAVAVIAGIAARASFENLICGIVISFSEILRVGDTVLIDGNYGTVEDITVTHTIVKVWDWRRNVIPNSQMLQKEFINYTLIDPYQWAYIEVSLSYDVDIELFRQRAEEIGSSFSADGEHAHFWVIGLDEHGVHGWLAVWVKSPLVGWNARSELRIAIVKEMQRLGARPSAFYFRDSDGDIRQGAPPVPGAPASADWRASGTTARDPFA